MGEVIDFEKYRFQKQIQKVFCYPEVHIEPQEFKDYKEVTLSFKELIGEAQIEYFAQCLHCSEDMNDFHIEGLESGFCSKECQQAYYIEFNKWLLERD